MRKQVYRSVLAGACGVTYGHHSVWQFYDSTRQPINHPEMDWQTAIQRPGAAQVQHLRALVESRPFLQQIPDQELIASPELKTGERGEHAQAARAADGSYALVYCPTGKPITLRLDRLAGPRLKAQWYDPRTGAWQGGELVEARGEHTFTPPPDGPDWVLVLDQE